MIVLVVGLAFAGVWALGSDDPAQGAGQITQLDGSEVCLQPGNPNGGDACYKVTNASELPDDLNVGDQVTVHHEKQRIISIELME